MPPEPARHAPRLERLDALRGLAMLWMTAFHLCFDLNYFGWIRQDFYRDPVWTWQRTAIVSLFLLCAGAGQAVAMSHGQSQRKFARRWAQVAGCALLVSASSYLMYPGSFIYFGVLHGIAVMLLILRLSARLGPWLWPFGAAAIALAAWAPTALQAWPELLVFNSKPLSWLGFISVKPVTEDFVPLLPWLGVMWWGMAGTQWALAHRPHWLAAPLPSAWPTPLRWLSVLGTWSLAYYMLHQPVMIGLLAALRWVRGG